MNSILFRRPSIVDALVRVLEARDVFHESRAVGEPNGRVQACVRLARRHVVPHLHVRRVVSLGKAVIAF